MRDSSIAPISATALLAALIAVTPVAASAHGHGHHGSGGPGVAFVPIFAPRIGAPGMFGPPVPGFIGPRPFFGPSPFIWSLGGPGPGPLPGWSGPPNVGIILGSPMPGGYLAPDPSVETQRESDLDQQIGALPPPPPDAHEDHSAPPASGEDDSGWSPL